jgi:nucleoside-diphosphate-sugar epimerase/FAD/FMN-containing dehydrogenase
MRETVCVTGASGGIGQALLDRLIDVYRVKALFRARSRLTDEWEQRGCTVVLGDLGDGSALSQLVAGARFVFHSAALVGQGSYRDAHATNVMGTRRLALAAAAHGCQRMVHVSSAAVYTGAPTGAARAETMPLSDRDGMAVYARTKLGAEQALREVAQAEGLQYTILRPTCVYGPRTKSYTLVPVELIRKGLPVVLGDGRGLLDVVYVDDVAAALVLAAQSPHADGEVFNIGHETVTLKAFYSHYARMLDRPARHLPMAVVGALSRVLRLGGSGRDGVLRELANGLAFLIEMAGNAATYPSTKAQEILGYAPKWNLSTGMLKTELWLKQEGTSPRKRHVLDAYGPLPFRPLAVAHPEREEDISHINRMALAGKVRVKAIGSLHSLCPIPETDGVCLVLDRYRELLKVEGSLATVQAGMTLRDLHDRLAAVNLALPISGSIAAQTVAGAISTGTHGGSLHHGSLSDYVESVRLVRSDGSVVEVDRSHGSWGAVGVSLGLLGIISAVTFRCVARFSLQSRSSVANAQEVFEAFREIQQRNRYVDMLYFPIVDKVEMLCINPAAEGDLSNGTSRRPPRPSSPTHGAPISARLRVLGLQAIARLVHHLRLGGIQRVMTGWSVGSAYRPRVGRSDLVLAFGDDDMSTRSPMAIQDMEIAVPYDCAQEALAALRDHFSRRRQYPLLPVHIRCSPRSPLWLSPAHGREVCWIEVWQYPPSDSLFDEIHELMKPFRYRFHWGKETRADEGYIRRQYERWDDFVRLREEWDPTGMFLNSYLESFFCTRRGARVDSTTQAAAGARVYG